MKSFKLFFSLFTLLLVSSAFATVPQLINFQGRLTDSLGNPVSDGSYNLRFRIYDDSLAGNVLWEETDPVQITKGLFTVLLGSTVSIPDSAFYSANRWLGIKIGTNPEITPRQRLASVGYSYVSSQWNSAGENLFRLNGNVSIGTALTIGPKLNVYNSGSDPFSLIGVRGEANNSSSGNAYGGYFTGSSSTGASYGVYGQSSSGRGVYGSGGLAGGDFVGTAGGSAGVTGQGVVAGVTGTGGAYGVYGASTSGTGVYGTSTNSYGVYASSTTGYGLYATGGPNGVVASASSGAGVYATSGGADGIYGSGANNGVHGYSAGAGVYGVGGNIGVFGITNVSSGYGILGSNGGNSATWAGYFQGDTYVTGNFTAAGFKSASVKMDDGEYRLLYAQESLENWFEDFGTAQMVNGQATVNIDPLYAQTVNTAVTYHVFLTPEGDCRGLYVTGKTPASFEMRELQNGKSNLSVSYRIVAKRKGYENIRLEKLPGKTPEEVQAEQVKMEAEHKKIEEQRAKMEQELKGTDKK